MRKPFCLTNSFETFRNVIFYILSMSNYLLISILYKPFENYVLEHIYRVCVYTEIAVSLRQSSFKKCKINLLIYLKKYPLL